MHLEAAGTANNVTIEQSLCINQTTGIYEVCSCLKYGMPSERHSLDFTAAQNEPCIILCRYAAFLLFSGVNSEPCTVKEFLADLALLLMLLRSK